MRILVTRTFARNVKKLHQKQKALLDETVSSIADKPELGEHKHGDIVGIQVYKFRMDNLLFLIAYRQIDKETIKLLMLGPHENFYRDLKRIEH